MTGKWHVRAKAEKAFDVTAHVRGGMPNQTNAGYNRPHEGKPDAWKPWDKSFDGFYSDGATIVPDEPLIRVPDPVDYPAELLLQENAEPWDGLELFVFAPQDQWNDPDATHVRLVTRLDNLGKGASGVAIQSLNLMLGYGEETGLRA